MTAVERIGLDVDEENPFTITTDNIFGGIAHALIDRVVVPIVDQAIAAWYGAVVVIVFISVIAPNAINSPSIDTLEIFLDPLLCCLSPDLVLQFVR